MFTKLGEMMNYEVFEELENEYRNYWIRKKDYGFMTHIIGIAEKDKIDIFDYILKYNIIRLYNEELEKLES